MRTLNRLDLWLSVAQFALAWSVCMYQRFMNMDQTQMRFAYENPWLLVWVCGSFGVLAFSIKRQN